jgi:CHRD domain/PEP-CTERM motif
MRRSLVLVGAFLLLAGTAPGVGATTIFDASLTGAQEVPPNASPASGTGTFVLNDAGTELAFTLDYSGLTGGPVVGAHFHNAPRGVNGPIVRGYDPALFSSPAGAVSEVWLSTDPEPLTPTLVSELLAGRIYFNIHTADGVPPDFPGGEIRGQLVAAAAAVPEPGTLLLLAAGAFLLFGFTGSRRIVRS